MKFWTDLSEREKNIILIGFPLFFLILLYYYLWEPVNQELDEFNVELPLKAAELAWMKHEIESANPWLNAANEDSATKPILTIIETRAIAHKVKSSIQRVQPDQNQQVKMWFQNVSADSWFGFISQLAIDGISVDAATITRTIDGKVNVRVTFKR